MGNQKMYFSTFITGFQELIPQALEHVSAPKTYDIHEILDGLIVYETDAAIKTVIQLPFFNNTFLHMATFSGNMDIKQLLNSLNKEFNFYKALSVNLPKSIRTFRLVVSHENQTVNPHPNYKSRLEAKIAKDLRMRIDANKPDTEFWLIFRSEGLVFLGMRLTKHPDYTTSLPKGALRPELAYLLTSLVPLQKDGVILDPFAGSGSIVHAALKQGWKHIMAGDYDLRIVQKLRRTFRNHKQVTIERMAIANMTLPSDSIDAIATNPPWGHHFQINIPDFYNQMYKTFHRILRQEGFVVLLVENTSPTFQALKYFSKGFTQKAQYPILVSGRKALVVVYRKN